MKKLVIRIALVIGICWAGFFVWNWLVYRHRYNQAADLEKEARRKLLVEDSIRKKRGGQ